MFKRAGIRFFVGVSEYDLRNPEHVLFLDLSAAIGKFNANNQTKKSILNRIERAKRGIPTCGKLPFGRSWDGTTNSWTVDPDKQAMVADVASRYIAGESLPKLATEYGVNHANLCKVLRERCGDNWEQEFRSDELKIHEIVKTTVPPLLPEATIRAVRQQLKANRTYLHKPPVSKYDYLLTGRVFCAACGCSMTGQMNPSGKRYYRHPHPDRKERCPLKAPRPWAPADAIEEAVVSDLFELLGTPAIFEQAVTAAIPERDKALRQLARITKDLATIARARLRILSFVEKDAITDAQADPKLRELKEREAILEAERDRIDTGLADLPDAATVRLFVERAGKAILAFDGDGNLCPGGNDLVSWLMLTKEDRRKLVDAAMTGILPDGKPAGVYLTPTTGPHKFTYRIRGRLVEASGQVMPRALP